VSPPGVLGSPTAHLLISTWPADGSFPPHHDDFSPRFSTVDQGHGSSTVDPPPSVVVSPDVVGVVTAGAGVFPADPALLAPAMQSDLEQSTPVPPGEIAVFEMAAPITPAEIVKSNCLNKSETNRPS